MQMIRRALLGPAGLTLLVAALFCTIVLVGANGNPLAIIQIGTRYSEGDPNGSQGYDGQFVYYIARELDPDAVAPLIDNPAYRYQRIVLPLLDRTLSLSQVNLIPWALLFIGLLSHAAGNWFVSKILQHYRVNRWYALIYGLWVGFLLSVRLALPEPLAYACVAAALYILVADANPPGRKLLAWLLFAAALFTKEVTALFVAGVILSYLAQRRWRDATGLLFIGVLPFGIFQIWLLTVFGSLGIGSGGDMATGFEWIPFMGLLRVGAFNALLLGAFALIFVPFVYFPSLWALVRCVRDWLQNRRDVLVTGLFFNAVIIPFIPFSTVREPSAMFRFGSGIVLAILLYAARSRHRRALNYGLLWLVLNVILLNELL